MPNKKRILVTRFSALGDVAMTIPVLWSIVKQNPDYEIVFVSQGFAAPMVSGITGITFVKADLKGKHKGFLGMYKLAKELKQTGEFCCYADLHNVLRTKILRLLLSASIPQIAVIDKGRKEKRALTRKNNKVFAQLGHSVVRYANVFKTLGLNNTISFGGLMSKPCKLQGAEETLLGNKDCTWIGIAPFAKHKGKIYPLNKMEEVIKLLSARENTKLFLFGGGPQETETLQSWESKFSNTISLAGKLKLDGELRVMSNLDVMLSMDSANMHLASLVQTPVVSIWGATHPFAGFYGWEQSQELAVQVDLSCRPCSVFGDKSCFRKDYACMNNITPQLVVERIESAIQTL